MRTPARQSPRSALGSLGLRMAALLGLLCLSLPTASQAQETIEDVARELRAWRDEIQSLHVEEEWTGHDHLRKQSEAMSRLTEEELQGYFHRTIWTWKSDGRCRFETQTFEANQLVERELQTCDGHLAGRAEFGKGPVAVKGMSELVIYPVNSDLLLYSKLRGSQMRSLMSLFEVVNGVIDGTWTLSYPPTPDNPLIAVENGQRLSWLDRRYGYLPVRRTKFNEHVRRCVSYHVTDFQKVNGTLWFPLRGWDEYPDPEAAYYLWEIREPQLNAELPDSDFETPTPDRTTRVEDRYRTPREARIKSELNPPDANSWSDILSRWFAVLTQNSNVLYVLLGGFCLLLGALITRTSLRDNQKSKSDKD